jgi:hypothetical protein
MEWNSKRKLVYKIIQNNIKKVTKKIVIIFSFILVTFSLIFGVILYDKSQVELDIKEKYKNIDIENKIIKNKLDSISNAKRYRKGQLESKIHSILSSYNPDISDSTVSSFAEIVYFYYLDNNKTLSMCMSQILQESTARHTDNNGNIIVSSGNAIGITQIVPSTAFYYLRNVLDNQDRLEFLYLGATDFSFVYEYPKTEKCYEGEIRNKIINWLEVEKNNQILWGFIMHHNIYQNNFSIEHSLIAYKDGNGFLQKWINKGKSVYNHSYIKRILNIQNKV